MSRDFELTQLLARYRARVHEFDRIAARRSSAARTEEREPRMLHEQVPSRREVSVLELVAEGYSNREIAARLVLSEDTIKSHVRNLLVKLGARNRAHAVTLGYVGGLIELPPPAGRPESLSLL